MLPPLVCLPYGPWLTQAARLKAALVDADANTYMAVRQSMTVDDDIAAVQGLVKEFDVSARTSLGLSLEHAKQLLSEACADVDRPGGVPIGLRKVLLAEGIMPPDLSADLRAMIAQARLSAANHTGNRAGADAVWEDFAAVEPLLPRYGITGLRLVAEIRNRRAVALTDQFRFDEAARILNAVVSSQEEVTATVAAGFGLDESHLPNRELAGCFGSLGQVYALRGKDGDDALAEASFRRAITRFSESADIERQWVYLGHLACDRGMMGKALWEEVVRHVPALRDARLPIAKNGLQFQLALQAKGTLVFGDLTVVKTFLSAWDKQSPLRAYPQASLNHHPFGLLNQTIGMMHARVAQESQLTESRQIAVKWFDDATAQMSDGGPILKVLSCVARIRRFLLVPDDQVKARQFLARALAVMKGILIEGIGDAAWLERDDGRASGVVGSLDPGPAHDIIARTTSIVKAFRFNYW